MSAWDPGQVKLFAKQIAESPEGKAWWVFPAKIRNMVISHHVLMTVFSQIGKEKTICIDDVRELRILIEKRLDKHHNLKTVP
jgi:hypothetical protein